MASYLKLMCESETSLLKALEKRRESRPPAKRAPIGSPSERFYLLMNHRDWGPGIKDYIRRNPNMSLKQLMYTIILKPDLDLWFKTGVFAGEERKKPPSRQEVHDVDFQRHIRKMRLSKMIRGKELAMTPTKEEVK